LSQPPIDTGQLAPLLEPNPAPELVDQGASLQVLAEAAKGCRACPLYAGATQTVFGEGSSRARIALVGEQPGDHEDREGSPFVGPAGQILWEAVAQADLEADQIYATNAVKHFKWTAGKWKRLHAKPNRREVEACLPWLIAEITLLSPGVIVGLGATACQAMLGPKIRITKHRGTSAEWNGCPVVVTYHPSAILRAPDSESRSSMMADLVEDLRTARGYLAKARSK
jgi:uracil-DNA glycosylase family protein